MPAINIFWFRRDLRLEDNAGLYHALKSDLPVLPLFIFDTTILDQLEDKMDARVQFIHNTLLELQQELGKLGSSILVKYGEPTAIWKQLARDFSIKTVFTNRDYEPAAMERDQAVKRTLAKEQIEIQSYKDHIVFEKNEVLKKDGTPYMVFTPYSRVWKTKLQSRLQKDGTSFYLSAYPNLRYAANFFQTSPFPIPSLTAIGFQKNTLEIPSKTVSRGLIRNYDKTRDFPALEGTSKLGIHFRFGTISIREKARQARPLNETYLNELIWRDFYSMILAHFPHVVNQPFRAKYKHIEWRYEEQDFQAWCAGKTGYPIVDAGMRELNATGYMHNRVRMIVASFLTKHLLLDWRLGEGYFAQKLLDFDLASNSGGWQWAAGCGTDAAPYFRIFNPMSQQQKFDKAFQYIKKWVPEYGTDAYVAPIVEHKFARERCLRIYKEGLGKAVD